MAASIADYFYVLRHGEIVFEGNSDELALNKIAINSYLGVTV